MRQFLLLLLVCPFTAPLFADTITHDRLRAELPGNWKTAVDSKGNVLRAQPDFAPNAGLIFGASQEYLNGTAPLSLTSAAQKLESGRTLLKAFPPQPQSGLTKSGYGYAFQSRISRGKNAKDVWYAAYYTFPAGARFQTIVALARSNADFQKIVEQVSPALDASVQVELPRAIVPKVAGVRGSVKFFNFSIELPADWRIAEQVFAHQLRYTSPVKRQMFAVDPFPVVMELQTSRPVDPQAALASFLLRRAVWNYRGSYSSSVQPQIVAASDGRLSNGLDFVSLVIDRGYKYKDDDSYRSAGYLVYGPGYSLLIGTSIQFDDYSRNFKPKETRADFQKWSELFESLPAHLATLQFNNDAVQRREDVEKWLREKKTFRYRSETSASSGDVSFYASTDVQWDFGADNSVRYDMERERGFNALDFDSIGRPDYSSGYLSGDAGTKNRPAVFSVWQGPGDEAYIVVTYPSGLSTFHTLQIAGNAFQIDGYRDGCCR